MKTRRHISKVLAIGLAAILGVMTAAPAGVITWEVFTLTGDVTDVSTNGTLVEARNGATSARTVNGVTFESVANSTNLFDSLFANDNIGNRGEGTVVTDSNYRDFLRLGQRSGRYGLDTPPQIECTQDWAVVELTDLARRSVYEFQIWAVDAGVTADGIVSNSATVVGNGLGGSPTVTDAHIYHEVTDRGTGQYAIGTFAASGTTQEISVRGRRTLNTTPTWSTTDHWANGWQLRLVYTPPKGTVFILK